MSPDGCLRRADPADRALPDLSAQYPAGGGRSKSRSAESVVVAFPRETVRLYELMRAERWAEARTLYEWFLPLLHLDIGPKFVQQIKLVEELMGLGSARVRSPRLLLDEDEARKVREVVEQALANRPMI